MRGCRWLLFKPSGVLRESFWGQSDAVTIAEGNIIKGDHMYVTKLSMMCVNLNYPKTNRYHPGQEVHEVFEYWVSGPG